MRFGTIVQFKKREQPDSVRVRKASLSGRLIEKNYGDSTISGNNYKSSNQVLEGKTRLLRKAGMGKYPKSSEPLPLNKEKPLWETRKLEKIKQTFLLQTMLFVNIQYFGQRKQQKHPSMAMENIKQFFDEIQGIYYVEYFENPKHDKTRYHGIHSNACVTNIKTFAAGGE